MRLNGNIQNLLTLLEDRAAHFYDRPLYSFLDKYGEISNSMSYLTLLHSAKAVAARVQQLGLYKEPVVLLYPQGVDFIVAFFGAILAGVYPVPMTKPRGQNWRAVESVLSSSGARAVLTVRQKATTVPADWPLQRSLSILYTDETEADMAMDWKQPTIAAADIAFIQYTSGSTSQPKGVAITHANVLDNSEKIRMHFGASSQDIGVGWLPFFHDMGLIGHIIQPLYTGIHNYFISPLAFIAQPSRWLHALSRYRGTISGGPNFAFDLCTAKISEEELDSFDLSSWRIAYCGAERISAHTLRKFLTKFAPVGLSAQAIYSCYGMAEATLFVCGRAGLQAHRMNNEALEYASVGTLCSTSDIRIVDPFTQSPTLHGKVGEIWIKSDSVAPGYYRETDSTPRIFNNTIAGTGGFLRSGDLGFLSDGDLYFVGRLKNLLKLRGSNYYAEDIETRIADSFIEVGIERSVAFSIEQEDREQLVILLEAGDRVTALNAQAICRCVHVDICQSIGITPYCVLMISKGALPLTTSGKPQRQQCKQNFLEDCYVTASQHVKSSRLAMWPLPSVDDSVQAEAINA